MEQLQQAATASECLDTKTEDSWVENCPVESSGTDSGHSETGKAEKDGRLSASTPTSDVRPEDHGLRSPEERVCFSSNIGRDYCQAEEEGREQPVVSTQSLSLCHRSEGAQSEVERENLTVGILPPAGCGKQAEETDRGEAGIREGQEATKGEDRSEQEEKHSTARRKKEEETNSESTDPITPGGDENALVMGQTQSLEGSEVSANSDSETKDCAQEEVAVGTEDMKLSEELCDGLSLDEEKMENTGLTDPVSASRDNPNPSLIDGGDVSEEPESAFSRLLIESLHKGEPPPDINSLEQNQETAGRDYATEQQQGLAPDTNSEDCTGTANGKELDGQDVAETSVQSIKNSSLPLDESDNTADDQTAGKSTEDTQIDQVDCMARSLSSDDDGSFRSVGSSTTEIFHPTQDGATAEEQDLVQIKISELSSAGTMMEESNDLKQSESDSPTVDAGLLSEQDADGAATLTNCNQTGTEPESQLPPSPQTMEPLNPEGTGEELVPELSKEDLSLGPVLSESEDSGEANCVDLNAEIEPSAPEVTCTVLSEPCQSVAEKIEVNVPVGGDPQSTETSDKSLVASGEENGHLQSVPEQQKQDDLEKTTEEKSPDEGLTHAENEISVPLSQSITLLSDSTEAEPRSPNNETAGEPVVENDLNENPKTSDAVDGASESHNSGTQGEQTLIYFSLSSGLF